jgi:hypothetical protein
LQHLNALTANLRAAGLLGLSVGLAVAVALAGVVASVVWVVGAITRRELRQEARRLSLAPMTQVAGRKFDWTGPGVAAVLLALLPLAGCGPSLVGPRNATAAAQRENGASLKALAALSDQHERQILGSAHDREEADMALEHFRAAVDFARAELTKAGVAFKGIGAALAPSAPKASASVTVSGGVQ